MRFVAMKLRSEKVSNAQGSEEEIESSLENSETWEPKLKGLLTTWLIVSKKLLEGRELEFCRWEGDALELLKDVRDKLNNVGEGIRIERLEKQDTISVQYSGMTEMKLWKWTVDMIMKLAIRSNKHR
ncbi:hypothetical protein IFM89_001826 [Coptis chinensis]|uniref:Uncharacterized protein n=1 Tax=Coptis chinensis TaxID=261450 RepID=A0A835HIF9_9MAGN|nr:hypothetical protein IFM89_001826 [Coptis chinensis]